MYHCKAIEKIESIQKIALKNNEIPKDILLKQNQGSVGKRWGLCI